MKSIADDLPPDIASQIHPDWRRNEAAYWAVRDALLPQYRDQWVAFADGVVVASGRSAVDVLHAGVETGRHPFVTCVGREEGPCRMRRKSAMPQSAAESLADLLARRDRRELRSRLRLLLALSACS